VQRIGEQIGRQMERKALSARDAVSSYLALEPGGEEGALADLQVTPFKNPCSQWTSVFG
jgi:hypothetical protein